MTVCIDTNVVLGMFGRNGPWLPIRQALMDRRLIWAITTEILLEYEEVAAREMGIAAAGQLLRFIDLLEQTRDNIRRVSPTFRFQLIMADPDDNKFTDCAITAGRITSLPRTATSPHSPPLDTIPSPSPRRSSFPSICNGISPFDVQCWAFDVRCSSSCSPPTSAPRRKNTPSPACNLVSRRKIT